MDNKYQNKKVLIFGLGLNMGGVGSAKFFASQGAKVRVTDLKTGTELQPSLEALKEYPKIEYVLGTHDLSDFDWADLIIKNPAVKPGNKYLEYAKQQEKKIETDMGIFLDSINPQQIIGVTGTKGKSTTTSLIYEALKQVKENVILAGNIGKSVLNYIPSINKDTLVVLELSSFQLESWGSHQVSPHIAVITNILPDHLNYYSSMKDYIQDKRYITQSQKERDYLFLLKGDQITNNPGFLDGIKSQIIYFSKDDLPLAFRPNLPGEHNLNNIAAAFKVVQILGIDQGQALEIMKNFSGMEFRMQLIKDWQGVRIYNDSAATNPDAAIQALNSLPNSTLITGGMNKNLDYRQLAQCIDKLTSKVYFLIGDATDQLKLYIQNKDKIMGEFDSLESLLINLKPTLKNGEVVLFSPGATSFNLFQNEFDRGKKFNAAVNAILR